MKYMQFIGCVVVILLASTLAAQDSTPQLIKLQGYLSDSSGGTSVPANGTYTMTFNLYDADLSGALIATAGPMPIAVTDGLYSVELPFGVSDFDGTDRYVEITVNGEVLSPRVRMVSAPFAYKAETLDGFEGADLEESAEVLQVAADLANHAGETDPHPVYVNAAGDAMQGSLSVAGNLTLQGNNRRVSWEDNGILEAPERFSFSNASGDRVDLVFAAGGAKLETEFPTLNGRLVLGTPDSGTSDENSIAFGTAVYRGGLRWNDGAAGFTLFQDPSAIEGTGVLRLQGGGAGSVFTFAGVNVGIGTTAPTSALTVDGVIETNTGVMFPDGLQTQMTLEGPQGPQGPQGPPGPAGPAVTTFCVEKEPNTCELPATGTCSCAPANLEHREMSPCTVTSDNGACSADGCPNNNNQGSCCVCSPTGGS